MRLLAAAFLLVCVAAQQAPPAPPASPVPASRLQTRWAAQVTPDKVLPESPRPQLAWKNWTNLNGTWSYAITALDAPRPAAFDGKILVPFPIESQLSGAGVWVTPHRPAADLPAAASAPHLRVFHDDAKVYLNGVLVAELPGANAGFAYVPLTDAARSK